MARARRFLGVLFVALAGAVLSPAWASAGRLSPWWSNPVRIDRIGGASAAPVLGGVSCSTAHLCVATDAFGNLLTSTAPANAWSNTAVNSSPAASSVALGPVACGAGVCATSDRSGHVVASADPTGGSGAWTVVSEPLALDRNAQVSCPTNGLCVIVDGDNRILSSTDPTSRSPDWNLTLLGGTHVLSAISCPTSTFCVAADDAGEMLTSSDPTGGAGAWAATPLPAGHYNLWAISCPALTFCAAVDHDSDEVLTSSAPAARSGTWRLAKIMPSTRSSLLNVSCTPSKLCVATDDAGAVHASIDPTAGARAWKNTFIDGVPNSALAGVLRGISCPTARLCVTVDQAGDEVASTDPAEPVVQAAKPTVSHASATLAGARAKIAFTLAAGIPPGGAVTQFALSLPRGLTASTARSELQQGVLVRNPGGRPLMTVIGAKGGSLTVRLKAPVPGARATVSTPAITVGRALTGSRRRKPLAIGLSATDSYAFTTRLRLELAP